MTDKKRFTLDIEWTDDPVPIGITLCKIILSNRMGEMLPEREYVAEFHGDSLDALLKAALGKISAEC